MLVVETGGESVLDLYFTLGQNFTGWILTDAITERLATMTWVLLCVQQ